MFYEFLENLWKSDRIDATKVQSYVPKFITQEEADNILMEPQTQTVATN